MPENKEVEVEVENHQKQQSFPTKNEQNAVQRQSIMARITLEDLYHILYLKPIQCVLDQKKQGLAIGLKIVDRKSQTQYELKQVKPIMGLKQYEANPQNQMTYLDYIRSQKADNMLCQMKAHGNLQMAICVCMYNETREMFNNTLQGIGENIINLYKQGVDPDKIVVIILQDGIQKMDKSVLQMFKVFEAESAIRFNPNKKNDPKDLKDLAKKIQKLNQNEKQYGWQGENNYLDFNSALFNWQQQTKRNQLRFINVKKKYDEVQKTLKQIIELRKKKNPAVQELPSKALYFFKKQCKKFRDQGKQTNQNDTEDSLKKYYDQVMNDYPNKINTLVQDAITRTKEYCQNYINSRLDMSHVSFFRTSQYFPADSGFSMEEIDELRQAKFKLFNKTLSSKAKKDLELKHNIKDINVEIINSRLAIKMNIFFVVKYRNNQKLSSHNWFFNGFCKEFSNWQMEVEKHSEENKDQQDANFKTAFDINNLSPKYTILLDVGLKPESQALCKMYNVMVKQQKIGGVCGYMGLKIEKDEEENERQLHEKIDFLSSCFLSFVDIQRAQQIEYHFAHLIDKGFQSFFKFIHVLPGAFSGYNMKAIWSTYQEENQRQNSKAGGNADELLKKYFKSIDDKLKNSQYKEYSLSLIQILCRVLLPDFLTRSFISPVPEDSYEALMYESNVYLAEDRILCRGINKNKFDLMFLPDAYSFVDPVKDIPSLMGQRKRWINGSYFAFQKVSSQFRSQQGCQFLTLQIWYLALMNMLAYVAPGFFMFSISVAMEVVRADILAKYLSDLFFETSQIFKAFVYTINFIYAMLIMGLVFFSINLTNKNQRFIKFVYALSTILGTMSVVMMVILVVDLARGLTQGSSYLISNNIPQFVQEIPGGKKTVDLVRYIVLGIMGLYAVPILFYSIMFGNLRVLCEILSGSFSFSFYSPTYLIILSIYALCRMDDLSWGTKGLDGGSGGKDKKVLDNWKIIKTIHVAKMMFWNVIVAGLMIHYGSNYIARFYLTFALMVLIAGTMTIKVILSILYYFEYKTCIRTSPQKPLDKRDNKKKTEQSIKKLEESSQYIVPSLYEPFKSQISDKTSYLETQLRNEIQQNLKNVQQRRDIFKDLLPSGIRNTFIQFFDNSIGNKIGQVNTSKLNVKKLERRKKLEPLQKKNKQPLNSGFLNSEITPIKNYSNQDLDSEQYLKSSRTQLYTPFSQRNQSQNQLINRSSQKFINQSEFNISLGVDEVNYDKDYETKRADNSDTMRDLRVTKNDNHEDEQNVKVKKIKTLNKISAIQQKNDKEEDEDGVQFFGSIMGKVKQKFFQ